MNDHRHPAFTDDRINELRNYDEADEFVVSLLITQVPNAPVYPEDVYPLAIEVINQLSRELACYRADLCEHEASIECQYQLSLLKEANQCQAS